MQKVPILPEYLDIAIIHPKNPTMIDETNPSNQPLLASNTSFHINHERFTDNLRVLARFHPWHRIEGSIDWESFNSLPEDGTVFHRIRSIQ